MKFLRDTYRGSEADLVGEFYFRARVAGLEVFLEVCLPSVQHRSGQMRVDAVVVSGDEIVCCVEGKREGREIIVDGRQMRAYKDLEYKHRIPTVWINSMRGIPEVVEDIKWLVSWRETRAGAA